MLSYVICAFTVHVTWGEVPCGRTEMPHGFGRSRKTTYTGRSGLLRERRRARHHAKADAAHAAVQAGGGSLPPRFPRLGGRIPELRRRVPSWFALMSSCGMIAPSCGEGGAN
jgi:hypothetical protein